jgi:2-polyprenyl-3-methyl-5-hydroxy-6-metoxy-1,4-benzoquinol methylase
VNATARFAFGANWRRFLELVDEPRIRDATASLQSMLEVGDLAGRSFLDVGSGSGLFSLAARRLGARVHSFDYDPQSVACTRELRRRYFPDDPDWTVEPGSVLDADYLRGLGRFDFVYSWGVLHHTGAMQQAFDRIDACVADDGRLFIAIYNDQGLPSRYWTRVKQLYTRSRAARPLLIAVHAAWLIVPGWLLRKIRRAAYPRGMSPWRDLIDWLGGYPFEVAKPEQVFACFRRLGYELTILRTVGGKMGCNEFVFRRAPDHFA